MSDDPAIHNLAWTFLKAYRAWFLAPARNERARHDLRDAVQNWAREGFPMLEGEGNGSSPGYVHERAGMAPVGKSAGKSDPEKKSDG